MTTSPMIVTAIDWSAVEESAIDVRVEMEYGQPYPVLGTHKCSVCGEFSDRATITKHYWANRPLGQLTTRCPIHQAYWRANPMRNGAPREADTAPELRPSR